MRLALECPARLAKIGTPLTRGRSRSCCPRTNSTSHVGHLAKTGTVGATPFRRRCVATAHTAGAGCPSRKRAGSSPAVGRERTGAPHPLARCRSRRVHTRSMNQRRVAEAPIHGLGTQHQCVAQGCNPLASVLARKGAPNPSLERTSTGKALGPRTGQCHHPLRGPSASPAAAAQLKR